MKNNIWLKCLALAVSVFIGLGFAGCAKKSNTKSSNSTANVSSNGGLAVKHNDTLYFVGGMDESTATNKNVTRSAIWKVKTNADGTFTETPKVFVSSIAGFEHGSLYIFGEYLYYATPSTSRDSNGETLSGIVDFFRIKLNGKGQQKLYSTTSADETELQYGYYASGEKDLYLVVYEKSQNKIVSVDVGTNPKTKTIAKDVTGVVLAENGQIDGANQYVFYTHKVETSSNTQIGNVVERVLPNGSNKTTISQKAKTYSLLTIRGGKLIYSESNIIYASTAEKELSKSTDTVVSMLSTSAYKDIIISADHIIVKDSNKNIIYISWNDGVMTDYKILEDTDATFLCEHDNKLFYTANSKIYSIELGENKTAVELTETVCDDTENYLAPEIVDGYLYFMNTTNSVTELYRISISLTESATAQKVTTNS